MTELYHYGIKNQKWGVRRYQNLDRTWTEEGKKRYGSGSDGNNKSENSGNFADFVKEHKKEIAIGAAVVGGTLLVIYGAQNASAIEAAANAYHNTRVNASVEKMFNKYKDARSELEKSGYGYSEGNFQENMKKFENASSYIGERANANSRLNSIKNVNSRSIFKAGEDPGLRNGLLKGSFYNKETEQTMTMLKRTLGSDNKDVKSIEHMMDILENAKWDSRTKTASFNGQSFSRTEIQSMKKLLNKKIDKVSDLLQKDIDIFKSSGKWDDAIKAREDGMAFANKLYETGLGKTPMANKTYSNAFAKAVGSGKDKLDALLNKDVYAEYLKILEEDIAMHSFEVTKWLTV